MIGQEDGAIVVIIGREWQCSVSIDERLNRFTICLNPNKVKVH